MEMLCQLQAWDVAVEVAILAKDTNALSFIRSKCENGQLRNK
eukprot:UN03806